MVSHRFQFGTKFLFPIVPCAFLYLSDVRTQADYQLLDPNFIGLIFSCFNEADKVTNKMMLAIQDESAKLCFIFPDAHNVLYSTGNSTPYMLQ